MENVFVEGLYAKKNEKSPDFVICNFLIKLMNLYNF